MEKYAVIKIGPFQYFVQEGETYEVPKFEASAGKKVDVPEVLVLSDGKNLSLGKPYVNKTSVQIEILEQAKGEKIKTEVYKAKSKYRRKKGFRKPVTRFKVLSIKS